MSLNWNKEVTLTLTIRDLYWLQHAADSVLITGEISDFTLGSYEPLTNTQYNGIRNAQISIIKVLKENK
jgi:hypothetical protein